MPALQYRRSDLGEYGGMNRHDLIQLLQKRIDSVLDRFGISKVRPLLVDVIRSERAAEYGWVIRNLGLSKGDLLDVGCGRSNFCVVLATQGFHVVALDLRDGGQRHPNLEVFVEDILRPSDRLQGKRFDRICCISVLEHLADGDDRRALVNVSKLLVQDGKILLSVPFGKRSILKDGTRWRERVYNQEDIEELMVGFEVELSDFFKESANGIWKLVPRRDVEGLEHQEKCNAIVCLKFGRQTYI